MIKDIKFNGYSAVPSDYECNDGSLAASINLISEDSQVKPLFQPKTKILLNNNGKLLLIHNVPNQTNWIICRDNTLYWMEKPNDDDDNNNVDTDDNNATPIAQFDIINDITIVGNTIAVASNRIEYLLWKDGTYHTLGAKPPFIDIEFGCKEVKTLSYAQILTVDSVYNSGISTPEDSEETSNTVYGFMLPSIANAITSNGLFYMPFFVRYAYRLYDGSHMWHSAPILMLPSVIIPQLIVSNTEVPEAGKLKVYTQLNIPYFQLNYKIPNFNNLLNEWKDVVNAIDIFITAPIYTYDQSQRITGITSTSGLLLDGYYDYNPNNYDPHTGLVTIPDNFFAGHYAASGSSNYIDHTISYSSENSKAWRVPRNDKFHEQIKSCNGGNFYKVASLTIDALSSMSDFQKLQFSSSEMDNLVTLERLSDEYQSHHNIIAKTTLSYNNRLCLTNLNMQPPVPFSLNSSVEASSVSQNGETTNVQIEVYTRLNGVICHNINNSGNEWDIEGLFPRYIYYPDNSAYKMNFIYNNENHFVELVPHDFLNGAYYYGTLAENAKPTEFANPETQPTATSIDLGNKIYVSEVNNPFIFPASYIVTVGNGMVLGLASAAKALSQGQFGQFPLYAFTTEGVWALEVSATGTFSAKQPISRDVCINTKSITPIDAAVLFATNRGIMLIAGSETRCISDNIKNETPFNILSLPHMDNLHNNIQNTQENNCLPTQPFTQFLSNCVMIYDYLHQHIYVGNNDYNYAYVFSLKSQEWGMIYSQINDKVPSYPYAYAIQTLHNTNFNAVVNFSCNSSNSTSNGLLVTRPLKLETPNILKTVNNVIIRGNFEKGKVQTALYGSRDLIHWHLIWSSKNHYLRGFSGTPYKYFRIACVTNIKDGESLFGASMQFTTRLTNQPR